MSEEKAEGCKMSSSGDVTAEDQASEDHASNAVIEINDDKYIDNKPIHGSSDVVVLDDDDADDSDIPDRETCQKLTEQFAEITGTDEACAQFYLQDRKWNLERSIDAFFDATQQSGVKALHDGDEPELVIKFDKSMLEAYGMGQPTSEPPKRLSLISWNVDGLDGHNLKRRTKAVCKIIYLEKPDIVFLQELIPDTYRYISEKLPEYMCIQSNNAGYFCAVLLRRFTIYYDSHVIVPYPGSRMSRDFMHVKAHIGNVKLNLLNTHLESGVEYGDERKNQMKKLFETVLKVPNEETVIFGGDLNMRDKELDAVGGVPPGMDDLWVTCGSRKECQYTWDTLRNTNRQFPGKFKPRCRFDRIYVRSSHPRVLVPKHFGLIGIQKVIHTQSYPSDHWAIQVFFDIKTA